MIDESSAKEVIDKWFACNFQSWGGYDTGLYNHVHAAKEELKVLLSGTATPAENITEMEE